jgi:peptide deformylase
VGAEKVTDWEGCLSVPGLRGRVPRFQKIKGTAVGRDGKPFAFEAEGFFARVLQHEGDHLDGKVYLDSMEDMSSLSFNEEFQKFATRSE